MSDNKLPVTKEGAEKENDAMRALESLTPRGSEFVNDIEACVNFVKEERESFKRHLLSIKRKENDVTGDKSLIEHSCDAPFRDSNSIWQ